MEWGTPRQAGLFGTLQIFPQILCDSGTPFFFKRQNVEENQILRMGAKISAPKLCGRVCAKNGRKNGRKKSAQKSAHQESVQKTGLNIPFFWKMETRKKNLHQTCAKPQHQQIRVNCLIRANRLRVPRRNPFWRAAFRGTRNCESQVRGYSRESLRFLCASIRANRPDCCYESLGYLRFIGVLEVSGENSKENSPARHCFGVVCQELAQRGLGSVDFASLCSAHQLLESWTCFFPWDRSFLGVLPAIFDVVEEMPSWAGRQAQVDETARCRKLAHSNLRFELGGDSHDAILFIGICAST